MTGRVKSMIEIAAACYGLVGTFVALFLLAADDAVEFALDSRVIAFHAVAMGLTFMSPAPLEWRPILRPTRGRVRLARVLLAAALLAAIGFLGRPQALDFGARDIDIAAAAFLMLSCAYMGVHWALRPENVFPLRWLRWLTIAHWGPAELIRRQRAARILRERKNRRADR
jgi:hypothetical protein